MSLPDGLLLAWLGDDFTGSAAVMEVLAFAGLPAVLFLDTPTPAQLARFPDARAIGIATTARSHSPDWMRTHLPRPFRFLHETGAPVIHYKTCSTLDSAPQVGSIGTALEIGQEITQSDVIPFLVAAPVMRRYQAFGQLFAAAPDGVHRLDRHPVMSRHPVTPMDEADVAKHLARQTSLRMGGITLEDLAQDSACAMDRETMNGAQIVTLDAMSDADMARNGDLIWPMQGQRLVGGSQGVEYALVAHWRATGALAQQDQRQSAGPADRIIAVSGSASPTTAAQIDWAEQNGFDVIAPDVPDIAEDAIIAAAHTALQNGKDPLICTARGPDITALSDAANARLGAALGRILKRLLVETGIRRAVISGGDTSGHACRELDLFAFTALAPTIPGAALLQAHSENPALAGLQLALKGGQMGSVDYFGWIKRGGGTRV